MWPRPRVVPRPNRSDGKYDFDTAYNRFGTDSTKYDQQIRNYGEGSVQVGMGIADMDFRAAPPITKALMDRMQHENWGYLDMGGPAMKSSRSGSSPGTRSATASTSIPSPS